MVAFSDLLGDRMKGYEQPSISRKAYSGQPFIARLDGKAFHTFTRGLKRPYDERLSELMQMVTSELVSRFQPKIGYTQSDEISLVWYVPSDDVAEYPFGGRIQKLESLLAATATAIFNRKLISVFPEKASLLPVFDCRVFVVPNLSEAANCLLWRQQDAVKNAVSMAAQSVFSHKSLQGLNSNEMQERLWKEKGINFNDYPAFFKRGLFMKRVRKEKILSKEELSRIPLDRHPSGAVIRSAVEPLDIWISKENDPVSVLFGETAPLGTLKNLNTDLSDSV